MRKVFGLLKHAELTQNKTRNRRGTWRLAVGDWRLAGKWLGWKLLLLSLITLSPYHLITCLSAADEIYVTSVEKTPVEDGGAVKDIATIVLNDCIKVKEIQVIKVGGRISLKYPTYVSKAGKEYPQFEPLTKQAKDEIEKAVEKGKPSSKAAKSISYKISKFSRFNRPSVLKVFCAADFNNAVRVECKVMEGKKGPWISWPSRKPEGGGKWVKQILIINKKLKAAVEKALMDKYKSSASESEEDE